MFFINDQANEESSYELLMLLDDTCWSALKYAVKKVHSDLKWKLLEPPPPTPQPSRCMCRRNILIKYPSTHKLIASQHTFRTACRCVFKETVKLWNRC